MCYPLGRLKYVTNTKVQGTMDAVLNQLDAYERYLTHRLANPQCVRVEAVFSFDSWAELVDTGWPNDTSSTQNAVVEAFFNARAVAVSAKTGYQTHMQFCLG